jgi:flagellar motor switch protein FliM
VELAGVLFAALGRSLGSAFAPIRESTVALVGAMGAVDFEVIGKSADVVAVTYAVEVLDRACRILLVIPQAALAAMGKGLAAAPAEPAPPLDVRWMQNIQKEVTRTSVRLSATLEERMGILGEITNLQVGQVIPLAATAQSRVLVECGEERLMWCNLGKSNDHYTLRVDSFVDREQEFMDDILAA